MADSSREELSALLRRIEEVRGLAPGVSAAETAALDDPAALVPVLAQLVDDLERSHRRLIETNVQLVSLREVASGMVSSLDTGETTTLAASETMELLHYGLPDLSGIDAAVHTSGVAMQAAE